MPTNVIGFQQERIKEIRAEIQNKSSWMPIKIPGVHLTRNHKINLKRLNGKICKINRVLPGTFCKKNHVIKIMAMGKYQIRIILLIFPEIHKQEVLQAAIDVRTTIN